MFQARRRCERTMTVSSSHGLPYGSYAAIVGTFVSGLAAAGELARSLDRDPACNTTLDFVVLSAAAFKASRTLARDKVTSCVREPFVEGGPRGVDERA
jgi:hypothetical protein